MMDFRPLPVVPQANEVPVLAVERWTLVDSSLVKTYRFRRHDDRDRFVLELFAFEKGFGHFSTMNVAKDAVTLTLSTLENTKPTELDREYAAYADTLFKDIVRSPEVACPL
jgi:pterin-4a-carbinolamine dehydratase